MAQVLFGHQCRVLIAAPVPGEYRSTSTQVHEATNLRTIFHVDKTLRKEPNKATITVHNLSPTSRAAAQIRGSRVTLLAGYGNSVGQVFVGDIKHAEHDHDGNTWRTEIEAADGARALRYARAVESFRAGTKTGGVLRRLVELLGVDPGNLEDALAGVDTEYTQGYAVRGRASREVDSLLRQLGLDWSIQDGRLQVLAPGAATTDVVIDLSSSSGLIGTPQAGSEVRRGKPPAFTIKSLLQPAVRPGGRVRVTSRTVNGILRVLRVVQTGDTNGRPWYSEIEATPL